MFCAGRVAEVPQNESDAARSHLRNLLRHLARKPVAELGGEPYTSVASLFAASEPRLG
jgi:hypothetical protein